ncbi:type VI secretion system contractile sheath large subunit, partial [Klebsiella pneumoniae]|uniref:type VI secretion system contractile sheath domain-containing protein n=1 Tax=Klebsiella pneumoniae TaxID=573 RepID=UPI00238188F8
MADTFQNEVPRARINLKLSLHTGGAVKDLPIHLYDLGTGNQVKIPSEVMIPETREFEFASLGFI